VAALLAMADCMAIMGSTPAEISNTLAFLQIDLTDPAFHRLALKSSGAVHAGIRALVKDRPGAVYRRQTEAAEDARYFQPNRYSPDPISRTASSPSWREAVTPSSP
jgi:hypothetical protein